MNDKTKKLLFIFSVCLNIGFILVAVYAFYQKSTDLSGRRHLNRTDSPGFFKSVGLSQQQQEEVDQLAQLFHANMLSVNKAVAPLKAELFTGMAGKTPLSDEEAQAILRKMDVLQNQRGALLLQHLKALRQVLTEEQTQELFARFAEIQNKWSGKVKRRW